jgi:hypothetical protein
VTRARRGVWLPIALVALAGGSAAGCRLSDPVFLMQDIRAQEPSEAGRSLIFGTIVVDEFAAGDLDIVSLAKVGPGTERGHRSTNRISLFRVFKRRSMKDGNFIIEVEPGIYELESFMTSGWMNPRTWTARDDVRRGTRVIVTRPGIYDIGTLRVALGQISGFERTYDVARSLVSNPERQAVLQNAISGTRWAKVPMAPMMATTMGAPMPSAPATAAMAPQAP